IWLLDTEMNIRYISPSIEKLLGYSPEEFEGKPAIETPLPFLQAIFQEASIMLAETSDGHKPFIMEGEQSRKDKKIIWTESLISIAKNSEGDFYGFLGVTRDINERKKSETLLHHAYERRKKADFFNQLFSQENSNDSEIRDSAWQNKVYVPKDFSLFFLVIDNLDTLVDAETNLHRKQQIIDALVDHLSRKESTIAWETIGGIGIINSISQSTSRKTKELEMARGYTKEVSLYFPDLQIGIGIANYAEGLAQFSKRLDNAKISLTIGRKVWPKQIIYHHEDCGFFQVLAPFAKTDDAGDYVKKMIGPLLEHDKIDGTDLVETLEKILSGLSFKEIGAQMYLHHKTIQLRKQRIEQILNLSLTSYETRLALSTAIQLKKISNLNCQ
ncbi:MAG TPA: PAS domain S-box protein, partial [Negativicutes bacterium]